MRNTTIKTLLYCLLAVSLINNASAYNYEKTPVSLKSLETNKVSFTENKGQVHDQNYHTRPDVLFGGSDGELVFHLKSNGISYQLNKIDELENKNSIYRLDINWLNTNSNVLISKGSLFEGSSNYYLENCPYGIFDVKSYNSITYKNLYQGIDLKWYQKDGHLKYDYIVSAGADYKKILLEFKGAEKISLNSSGELVLKTPLGEIIEQAPIVTQNGKELISKWLVRDNLISFEVENINPNEPFTIDPIVRIWGTYYGDTGTESGNGTTTDNSGNVFLAGATNISTGTTIATSGSHQTTIGGNNDAFIAKFNSSGIRQWATYYGGSGSDIGNSCALDASGNIFLAGTSSGTTGTVIATSGSHQSLNAGNDDAFLVKFNAAGIRQWGTYYGAAAFEIGASCAVDASNNVYMTGYASSAASTIIATLGSHQQTFGGGSGFDAYLVKFNTNGVRQWGTFYGGTLDDRGSSCCVDPSGNIYISGSTSSSNGTSIATASSHQSIYGGNTDAFLAKFNSSGVRQWATYYGGVDGDNGYACFANSSGDIYLVGATQSSVGTIIATIGSHQPSYAGGTDALLVKFNSSGIRQWGSYYGGTGYDEAKSCTIDGIGNLYVSGRTQSNTGTVIATNDGHQNVFGGGFMDAFLARFNSLGNRQWGTYYGGSTGDEGYACSSDAAGNIYLSGYTTANVTTVIASPGSHQPNFGGGQDAFLAKFGCQILNLTTSANSPICAGNVLSLTASTTPTTSLNYLWNGPNTYTSNLQNPNISNAQIVNGGTYSLTISDIFNCSQTTQLTVTINALPNVVASSNTSLLCVSQTASLTASGANNYTWNPGGNGTSISISPTITTTYTLVGIDANGCYNTAIITQSVDACAGINELLKNNAEMILFPNPSNGLLNLQISNPSKITITNIVGQEIFKQNLSEGLHQINIENETNGVYIIKAQANNKHQTIKVIKN